MSAPPETRSAPRGTGHSKNLEAVRDETEVITTDGTAVEVVETDAEHFARHAAIIDSDLPGFIRVGNSLLAIKARKSYRSQGYGTFEECCDKRFNIGRQYGHRLVLAATVTETLTKTLPEMSPRGDIPLPVTEVQVRALAPLRKDEETMTQAWVDAVERSERDQPTGAEVVDAVDRFRPVETRPTRTESETTKSKPRKSKTPSEIERKAKADALIEKAGGRLTSRTENRIRRDSDPTYIPTARIKGFLDYIERELRDESELWVLVDLLDVDDLAHDPELLRLGRKARAGVRRFVRQLEARVTRPESS